MRQPLIYLFCAGVIVLLYASLLEADRTARTAEFLLGGAAMIAVCAADGISKKRMAKRHPYTTTDWLKGKRPFFNPARQWYMILLAFCWCMQTALSSQLHARARYYVALCGLACCVAMIGTELFRKNQPVKPLDGRLALQ